MDDCRFPPPLSDDDFSAAIDGVAPPQVREHLAGCAGCAARLDVARQAEHALRGRLAFWDCPSSQQLGDYQFGLLPQNERRAVDTHITDCVRCTAELAELGVFLNTGVTRRVVKRAPPLPRPRLGELVARLLPQAPAFALRGAASRTLSFAAGNVTVMLELRAADGERVMLEGQILDDTQELWAAALVELRQGGALQATAFVDEFGGFVCGPLAPASAELRITPERGPVVVVPDIDLGAAEL